MMSIPKLTADQVADILGIARRDLARLVADGILQPSGAGARGGRRFPASQVEAVLNGSAPAAATAPRRPADRPGRRAGHRDGQSGGGDPRAGYLHALRGALAACAGPELVCVLGSETLGWEEQHPCLRAGWPGAVPVTVWLVKLPGEWRFFWNRHSRAVSNPADAAKAIISDLRQRVHPGQGHSAQPASGAARHGQRALPGGSR